MSPLLSLLKMTFGASCIHSKPNMIQHAEELKQSPALVGLTLYAGENKYVK